MCDRGKHHKKSFVVVYCEILFVSLYDDLKPSAVKLVTSCVILSSYTMPWC